MQKALLVVAHGSRRKTSNDEVVTLTASLARVVKDRYITTSSAFLELAQPSIQEGVENLIYLGIKEIDVLPYFLSAGKHVAQDIPEIIEEIVQKHPHIKINLKEYIGASSHMVEYISHLLNET